MKELKKSYYSFFVKKDNGDYVVYSSLTGAIVYFSDSEYIERLEEILDKEVILYDENNDIIKLLTEKKIFVDKEQDERISVRLLYEESVIRNTQLEIMLIVTRECNFRCTYCGQPHISSRMKEETYDSVIKFIEKQIRTRGYRKVKVTFFGGEPLLEYMNICNFLTNLNSKLTELGDIELTADMSTNGYLLTPKKFENLVKLKCTSYQISVDGMGYTHNLTRPHVTGKATWDKIMDNIKYMITTNNKFCICLRTNYNLEVAESLKEFYKYIGENLNDPRITIYYETIKDQGNENMPDTLNEVEGMLLNISIATILKENNLNCSNTSMRHKPCSRICYAGKPNYFIVDQNGKVLKCSYELESENNIIGILQTDGTFDMDYDKYAKWTYTDYLSSEECQNCKVLPLCMGKRCPKGAINKNMQCNPELKMSEIEGTMKQYF